MGDDNRYIIRQIDFKVLVVYINCSQLKVEIGSSGENLKL